MGGAKKSRCERKQRSGHMRRASDVVHSAICLLAPYLVCWNLRFGRLRATQLLQKLSPTQS
jgi:hypothetical protein